MPPRFHIGRFHVQHLLGQFSLLPMGHVDDPALRINPRQRHRQRPGEDEVTERAQMENQNVAPREHYHADSIQPPPSTTSASYKTTAWPGVIALCGCSKSILI